MTRIIRVIAAVVLCAGAAAIGAAQVPSRTDAPTTGTAQMRGRVFDAAAGKPLRRAQIRLTSSDFRQNFLTASDDCDPIAATPHHKNVRVRLTPLDPESTAEAEANSARVRAVAAA